jgi:hypothetical protein
VTLGIPFRTAAPFRRPRSAIQHVKLSWPWLSLISCMARRVLLLLQQSEWPHLIVVRIVLPIGITSSPVIFLPPPLVLLLPLSMPIEEELFIIIRVAILCIIKFDSAVITDPNFLREFCDLYDPSTVAHLHSIIA